MRIFVIIAICLLLQACKSVQYVPVETAKTEYVDRVKQVHDTMHTIEKETTYINGDTVLITKYVDRVKVLHQTDTCIMEKTDTVQVPYPVERKLSKWEQVKDRLGSITLTLTIIAIIGALIYAIFLIKRKTGKQ